MLVKLTKNLLITKHSDVNFKEERIGKFNFFDGHWQNPNILINNKKFILEAISKNKIVKDMLASSAKPGSTVLHVRRGDYLKINEELKESFTLMQSKQAKTTLKTFTTLYSLMIMSGLLVVIFLMMQKKL